MSALAIARTNCIFKKTNCILCFLPLLLTELRWGEAVLGFEIASEGGSEAEAGGSSDVGDAHVGTAYEQAAGMLLFCAFLTCYKIEDALYVCIYVENSLAID